MVMQVHTLDVFLALQSLADCQRCLRSNPALCDAERAKLERLAQRKEREVQQYKNMMAAYEKSIASNQRAICFSQKEEGEALLPR